MERDVISRRDKVWGKGKFPKIGKREEVTQKRCPSRGGNEGKKASFSRFLELEKKKHKRGETKEGVFSPCKGKGRKQSLGRDCKEGGVRTSAGENSSGKGRLAQMTAKGGPSRERSEKVGSI